MRKSLVLLALALLVPGAAQATGTYLAGDATVSAGDISVYRFTASSDDVAIFCEAEVCIIGFDPDPATDGEVAGRSVTIRICVGVLSASAATANACPDNSGSALTGAGGDEDTQLSHRSFYTGVYLLDVTGSGTVAIYGTR